MNCLIDLKNKNYTPKTILDIGANIGDFAKMCNALWPSAYILMLEGNEMCQPYLIHTGLDYKIVLLGDTNRQVDFYLHKTGTTCTGNSYYRENTQHYQDCIIVKKELSRLDDIVNKKFDLIKIDTQGSELDIIKGGNNTIKNADYILLEASIQEYNLGGPKLKDVVKYMETIGFKRYEIVEEHIWPDVSNKTANLVHGEVFQVDIMFYKNDV